MGKTHTSGKNTDPVGGTQTQWEEHIPVGGIHTSGRNTYQLEEHRPSGRNADPVGGTQTQWKEHKSSGRNTDPVGGKQLDERNTNQVGGTQTQWQEYRPSLKNTDAVGVVRLAGARHPDSNPFVLTITKTLWERRTGNLSVPKSNRISGAVFRLEKHF